jgi:hypothetical protein
MGPSILELKFAQEGGGFPIALHNAIITPGKLRLDARFRGHDQEKLFCKFQDWSLKRKVNL